MRFRQFVFVTEDLDAAQRDIEEVLGLECCHRDPNAIQFGLKNVLFPLGGNFLEVIAPAQEGTAAGRFLERRGGPGGYMVMVQSADARSDRVRLEAQGVRSIWQANEPKVIATHFDPRDIPGCILSIDTMDPGTPIHLNGGHWEWVGSHYQSFIRDRTTTALCGFEMRFEDPSHAAAIWSNALQTPVETLDGVEQILLDNARIRFVQAAPDESPGIAALDLLPQNRRAIMAAAEARDARVGVDSIELCGVRINLL